MIQHLGVRAIALLLPIAALAAAAPAAHAERAVTTDPAGDVVFYDQAASQAAETDVLVPAPENSTSDITRVVVNHRPRLIRVSVKLREVGPTFGDTMIVQLRTPDRRVGVIVLRRGGETFTAIMRGYRDVECGGLLSTVDSRTDKIVVSVPTSCIDAPRWVRVGVLVAGDHVVHTADTGDGLRQFVDDGFAVGFRDHGRNLGAPVRRG